MAPKRERTPTPPLVFLSLCLSLLAVGFSTIALLMVYDQIRTPRESRASLEIRAVGWNWEQRIGRMEKYLERLGGSLRESGEKGYETAREQMWSVRNEMKAWVKAAGPRLKETIGRMSAQAEELRLAVNERSERAADKLRTLRGSLRVFREQVGQKESEAASGNDER